jgi:hypothetical protein
VDVLERYLVLGLRLGRHIDGFVDAYYGPPALEEQVDAEGLTDPSALAAEAAELSGALSFDEAHRNVFLRAQLAGCEATARRLAGEPISWADEVERCYGVRPEPVPEKRFADAHEKLDAALLGSGSLAERYRGWLETQVVDPAVVEPASHAFEADLRERTRVRFGLPDDESVLFETVENEPWAGFNYYLGGRRSRVVINTDLPVHSFHIPDLVAHEMYPGHHTEHVWKETLLVDGEGKAEEAILLTGTPQAIISEGIAKMALEMAHGDEVDVIATEIYATFDSPYDAEVVPAVRAFRAGIEALSVNTAHLLHEEGRPASEARAYLERWSLLPPERVEKSLEFLTHPTWRSYVSSYSCGYELCSSFVDGDPSRFRTLLTTQLTTADLRGGDA